MDTAPHPHGRPDILSLETEAERRDRLAWEAEGIAKAEASLAAGLYVDADEIDAWIDSIGTRTMNAEPIDAVAVTVSPRAAPCRRTGAL